MGIRVGRVGVALAAVLAVIAIGSDAAAIGPPPPVPPAGCAPPTDGRVALWRGEGTAEDSVGPHDGTLLNGGGYEPGIVGSAFSLPGGDDHVAIPDAADLDVTGDLTLDTWVRLDDENFGTPDENGAGGDRVIFWKLDDQSHDTSYVLFIEGDQVTAAAAPLRYLTGDRSAEGGLVSSEPLAWRQGTWYHVALTRSANTISFYRDGAAVGTASVSQAGRATDEELALGVAPQDGNLYNPLLGDLDEPAVWSRALTDAEVKAINDTGTGACRVVAPPPPPPAPVPPPAPRNLTPPAIVPARSCPETIGGSCRIISSTYRCDPGTWENGDESRPYTFTWERMTRDNTVFGGYRATAVAGGETFHASSATRLGMDPSRWLFRCRVEAFGAGGSAAAVSPRTQLEPEYEPLGGEYVLGDFGIRGIDAFQVVQPNAEARAYGWDPARDPTTDQPLKDAGAAELTFAFGMAGGGTPTNYRRTAFGGGTLPAGADAQRVDYDGVTLDAAKPTVAVVYAGRKGPAPSGASSHPVRVTLRAKLDGRPYDSPLVRELVRLSEIRQLFVTAAERRDALFGVQFQLPASWIAAATGGRLDLEADITLAPLLGFGEQSQCGGEAKCAADDRFRLIGVRAADVPRLRMMGVRLAKTPGEQNLSLEGGVLSRAQSFFPGGQNWFLFTSAGELSIAQILNDPEIQAGKSKCEKHKPAEGVTKTADQQLRDCREEHIGNLVVDWEARNAHLRPLHDMVIGVHDYPGEPGWAIGARLGYPKRTRPPIAFLNNGSMNRPRTAAAHEIGHLLDLPHAGRQCPEPPDASGYQTAPGKPQAGELWPADDHGRLQGTLLDANAAPARDLATAPLTPFLDGQYFDPAAPGGTYYDLMSYCAGEGLNAMGAYSSNAWLSARNWNHSMGIVQLYAQSRTARVARAAPRAATGSALVIGGYGPGGAAVDRIVPSPAGAAVPPPVGSSPLRVRAYGAGGALLAEAGATLSPNAESTDGGSFTAGVPAVASVIEIVRDGRVLDRRERSRPPAVRVTAPRKGLRVRRGDLVVGWQAGDPDGGSLQAIVDYSADGGATWRTLFEGPAAAGRARLAASKLQGSRRARVRVAVNDGFNEARAVSGVFRVDGSPPAVRIQSPAAGEALRSTGRTVLRGAAQDDALRLLGGKSLTWFAGRRRLGTGERLTVRLPAGRFVLRLLARDRSGRTATARRTVRVAGPVLRLHRLSYERTLKKGARFVSVTIATSMRATASANGRRFAVGPTPRVMRIALPRRPATGRVGVAVTIRGAGAVLRGRVTVFRP